MAGSCCARWPRCVERVGGAVWHADDTVGRTCCTRFFVRTVHPVAFHPLPHSLPCMHAQVQILQAREFWRLALCTLIDNLYLSA